MDKVTFSGTVRVVEQIPFHGSFARHGTSGGTSGGTYYELTAMDGHVYIYFATKANQFTLGQSGRWQASHRSVWEPMLADYMRAWQSSEYRQVTRLTYQGE